MTSYSKSSRSAPHECDSTTPPTPIAQTTRRGLIGSIVLAVGLASCMLGLAPEPDPVPRRWQLELQPGELRMATFDVPNLGPRRYFYMTYIATNNSGQDVLFAPAFDMANGEGDIFRSGRDVPQVVAQSLMEQTRNPLIADQVGVIGDILQGPENAKRGLVIWPAVDLNPAEIIVYVGGLSGETATVTSPDGKTKFVLRKTLQLQYAAPGDLSQQGSGAIALESKGWIMR